jgi:hypothetical protein
MVAVKPGARLRSTTCGVEVIVVRASADELDLACGGRPMVAYDAESSTDLTPISGLDGGTLVGKRYVDGAGSVELLATKGGSGSLAIGGEVLQPKEAKALPASD